MRAGWTGRRSEPRVERRRAQVEINLLVEVEKTGRLRRGCATPFFGGAFLVAIEAIRIVTG